MCGICKTNKSKHRVELIKYQISQFNFSSKGSKETLKLQHFGIGIDATWNLWSCFVASSTRGVVDGLFNQNKLNCGQSVKWECERVRIMIGWLTEKYIHELTIALNEQSVTIEDYWRSHNSRVEFWHRRAEAGRRCVWLFFQPQHWTHNRVSFPFCEVGNFTRKLSRFTVECVAPPHARKLSLLVGLLINITSDDNAIFPSLYFHYLALIERKVKFCVFCWSESEGGRFYPSHFR